MGQYYLIVNIDKKEFIDPSKLGDGIKLLEIVGDRSFSLAGLALLLADGNGRGGGDFPSDHPLGYLIGRWSGDRIVVAGDYGNALKFVTPEEVKLYRRKTGSRGKPNLYEVAHTLYDDISEKVLALLLYDPELQREILEFALHHLQIVAEYYARKGTPATVEKVCDWSRFLRALWDAYRLRGDEEEFVNFVEKYCVLQQT